MRPKLSLSFRRFWRTISNRIQFHGRLLILLLLRLKLTKANYWLWIWSSWRSEFTDGIRYDCSCFTFFLKYYLFQQFYWRSKGKLQNWRHWGNSFTGASRHYFFYLILNIISRVRGINITENRYYSVDRKYPRISKKCEESFKRIRRERQNE